jgi:precorrin-3B synthase
MNAILTRGACPGLSAPMQTGDGLLVRLVPQPRVDIDAFIALCALARRHGNGVMEITTRGNLQVRGLTAPSAPLFAAATADLEVASTCRVPLITDPLPDDADVLVDVGKIAAEIGQALEDARWTLAPKISVAIDGGSRLHLDGVSADVRLRAVASAAGPRLHVALGGDAHVATPLGTVAPDDAAIMTAGLLAVIARHGPGARATDVLQTEGTAPFRSVLADRVPAAPRLPARAPVEPIGRHALRDGRIAVGIAPAFGQADAPTLSQLASVARDFGARALRPAPGRALLLAGLDEDGANGLIAAAGGLGFIARADDPRRRIAACAGKPACASAFIPTRALAAAIAPHLSAYSGDVTLHISGCAKGCAHPAPAALTVVGSERGCGIVHEGSARDEPLRTVDAESLVAELTHAEARHG